MYDTSLLDDAEEQLRALRSADIVVGIPSYRNARTVGAVARGAGVAVHRFFPDKKLVLVNVDANSSDGTPAAFMRARLPEEFARFSTGYRGLTGHGSATRAVFEVATRLGADACIVLDAGLTDVQPNDIRALLAPVLEGRAHLVLPMHQWSFVDAAFEDLIVYPMVRLMYGRAVRRPLSGDWSLSGRLAQAYSEQDVWETDAARGGLDIWLLVMALASEVPLVQVPSCHKQSSLVFGTTAYDQRFTHTLSTLFRHLGSHQRLWRNVRSCEDAPAEGPAPTVIAAEERPTADFWRGFRQGMRGWRRLLRRILRPENYEPLTFLAKAEEPGELDFPDDLWARMVLDFGVCFNKAELDPDKVAASLSAPFFARSLALWNRLDREGLDGYEDMIHAQALAFEKERHYLRERWDTYVAWVPDSPIR